MKKHIPIFFAAASLLVSGLAFAHHDKDHKWPCADDVKKFSCAADKGDHEKIMSCLDQHESELSTSCKDMREKMKAAMKEFKDACGSDVDKYCAKEEASHDHKAMHECMKKHHDELSASCKDFQAQMKKKWEEHKKKASEKSGD